jgi:hypothetical protein
MTPKLTAEQREALGHSNGLVPVEDDQTNRLYFLVDPKTLEALKRQEDLAAIQAGIDDMEAGRVISLEELDSRIRSRLGLKS